MHLHRFWQVVPFFLFLRTYRLPLRHPHPAPPTQRAVAICPLLPLHLFSKPLIPKLTLHFRIYAHLKCSYAFVHNWFIDLLDTSETFSHFARLRR